MTSTVSPPVPGPTAQDPASRGSLWRRHRGTVALVMAVLAAFGVAVALTGTRTGERLDPDNPGGTGGRAAARVLADQGVDVEVARSAADLEGAMDGGAATTVLVTSADNLGPSTTRRLLDATAGSRVVVAEPSPTALEALGSSGDARPVPLTEPVAADCTDTGLAPLEDLEVQVADATAYSSSVGCFGQEAGWLLAPVSAGVAALGAGGILENDQVLRADNAAVALRLLGQDERLVWYVPSLEDLQADDGVTLGSLLPSWLVPALWVAGLAMLALIWWRGRRLGPLSLEPLPVVVRAVEATEGRGRLYRRSGDRAHAADVLRRHTRREVARALRLGGVDDAGVVVREAAHHLGRRVEELDAILGPDAPPPADDTALVHLASQLAALETEVRRP